MGVSGRCLSTTSDALGCVCWGPQADKTGSCQTELVWLLVREFLYPLLWPFLLRVHLSECMWLYSSVFVLQILPCPRQTADYFLVFQLQRSVSWFYHAWLLSTCLLQGVRGTVLVGPQLKLRVYLVLRVSGGFWELQELRVPQVQEETQGHLDRQDREESRCVPPDEPWPELDRLLEENCWIIYWLPCRGSPDSLVSKGSKVARGISLSLISKVSFSMNYFS